MCFVVKLAGGAVLSVVLAKILRSKRKLRAQYVKSVIIRSRFM